MQIPFLSLLQKLESVGFQSIVTPAPSAPSKTRTEPSTQKTHVDLWNERYDELKKRVFTIIAITATTTIQ